MTRFCALAFVLMACNQDPTIGPEPVSPAESATVPAPTSEPDLLQDAPEPPDASAPDAAPAPDPAPTMLLSPPAGPPPPSPHPDQHPDKCGTGYLPNMLYVGQCNCHKALCPHGECGFAEDGTPWTRAFCFDAGLPYNFSPR
jgi:hypothetical protein